MLKTSLLIISLSLIGCGTLVPEFPEVWQCAYSVRFSKFRCVNTKTKQKMNLRLDASIMEGAQCLSLDDYKKSEHWVRIVKETAEQRCK